MNEKPLVNKEYLLEKMPGKCGWTYTIIPEIQPDPNAPFGWVKVRGSIDGYEIRNYHLMPSGEGDLLLAVKSEIRKKIKKQAGDCVHITLYPDNEPIEIPEEFLLCLQDDSEALQFFNSLNKNEQEKYVKWIYSAKTEQTKVNRIAETLVGLSKSKKYADRE
ncbi:YdeI/OmpD-associated family protein [uncultured Bacteroides sp.]|uniref:YdeI/OmpD-associated family protein n=1 Tax=uncultured Bacteroides sp. TaxID=162156 RepID=UPI0025D19AFC|nr:YdeI/OmpD-associated family protein [uncultured Bacteroides sp.]